MTRKIHLESEKVVQENQQETLQLFDNLKSDPNPSSFWFSGKMSSEQYFQKNKIERL